MANLSKAELRARIAATLPDVSNIEITPAAHRALLVDLVDSLVAGPLAARAYLAWSKGVMVGGVLEARPMPAMFQDLGVLTSGETRFAVPEARAGEGYPRVQVATGWTHGTYGIPPWTSQTMAQFQVVDGLQGVEDVVTIGVSPNRADDLHWLGFWVPESVVMTSVGELFDDPGVTDGGPIERDGVMGRYYYTVAQVSIAALEGQALPIGLSAAVGHAPPLSACLSIWLPGVLTLQEIETGGIPAQSFTEALFDLVAHDRQVGGMAGRYWGTKTRWYADRTVQESRWRVVFV